MLVLNASYEPINVCTVRRAAVLVLKARAEVLEKGDGALHSERLELDRPCVIRLVRYVRIPRDVHRRKITRKAVLARDAYTCQYCGHEAAGLTVDHVIPRSRGGESEWDNIVASCAPCNRKKGNRMPREARMHPTNRPKAAGPDRLHPDRRAPGAARLGAVPARRLSARSSAPPRSARIAKGRPEGRPFQGAIRDGRRILDRVGQVPAPRPAGAWGWIPPGGSHAARPRRRSPAGRTERPTSGPAPPGSRKTSHSTSDHLLSLVQRLKQTRWSGFKRR